MPMCIAGTMGLDDREQPLAGRTGIHGMGRNISLKIVVPFALRTGKNRTDG